MRRLGQIALAFSLTLSVSVACALAVLVFSGVLPVYVRPPVRDADYGPPRLSLEALSFSDLKDWRRDNQSRAIPAFLRSCDKLDLLEDSAPANPMEALGDAPDVASLAGRAGDWREACEAARALRTTRYADATAALSAARGVFEYHFRPVLIVSRRKPLPGGRAWRFGVEVDREGLVTGYYEPIYHASTFKTLEQSAPVLRRPANLVTVDLGAFRKELAGQRIAGFVEDGALRPYPDHRAINGGALGEPDALAWVDPNDLFFLQIQGSGRLRLQNGREMRVGFDGQNGRPYTAIGKILVDRGELTLENVSMQTIRQWLAKSAPQEAQSLREANESYVFFRTLDDLPDPDLGPYGAGGVQLEPARSIAADRRYYAMGAPVWLSVPPVAGRTDGFSRLHIAQDTGGAIRGPLRADVFLGAGDRAGEEAGRLRAEGDMIVLVPRALAARLEASGALQRGKARR